MFVSLPKGEDPLTVELNRAIALIEEKRTENAPIYTFDKLPVHKGKGRFGPFLRWNGLFININRKYDFDNLTNEEIETLIKEKIQKEKEKLIKEWPEEAIRIEKGRWGRSNIISASKKVELGKEIDPTKISLEEAIKYLKPKSVKKKKMSLESLVAVSEESLSSLILHPKQALGKNIKIHTDQKAFQISKGAVLLSVGVLEIRNTFFPTSVYKLEDFRKCFYRLFPGNWNFNICDLGNLPNGASPEDTYFALKEICVHLRQLNIVTIVIGGSHDLIYPIYQSYKDNKQLVNIVSVDNQFDFSQQEELISGRSYMSRIIMEQPNFLYNFTNLGYQSYYIAQEELDLMEKLHFDSLKLGSLLDYVAQSEPFLGTQISLDLI